MEMGEETPNPRRKDSLKRRSSIFQRRSLLPIPADEEIAENDETKSILGKCSSPVSKENSGMDPEIKEPFDLRGYIDSLKHEKKSWHDFYQELKVRNRKLVKKKALIEQNGQDVDLSVLSESERNFIEARPNYEHIVKSSKTLVDMAVKVAVLNQQCNNLNKRFKSKLEGRIQDATAKVISMVD